MWFWSKDPTKDFPYDITEVIAGPDEKSIWTLHKGKKRVSRMNNRPEPETVTCVVSCDRVLVILFQSFDLMQNLAEKRISSERKLLQSVLKH